jgi:hypothetical protein
MYRKIARRFLAVGAAVCAAALPFAAAAHPPCCVQCVNPHGGTIPSAGSLPICSTGVLHTTRAGRAGHNPDGFFLVGTTNGESGAACGTGSSDVILKDQATGQIFFGPGPGGDFGNGTTIKYTQAPGNTSEEVKPIGGPNSAVDFHLIGSGDLVVCSVEDPTDCTTCLVPPPPK